MKREQLFVPAATARYTLQERSSQTVASQPGSHGLWFREQAKEIGLREHFGQRLHHAFASAVPDKPIMNNGHSQRFILGLIETHAFTLLLPECI
jgi:hypothetical protein